MPNANTKVADSLTARAIPIERAELGLVEKTLEILSKVQEELISNLAKLDPTEVADRFKAQRLESLLSSTEKSIARLYAEMRDQNIENLVKLAKIEAKNLRRVYQNAVGVDLLSIELPASTLRALAKDPVVLGGPASAWWEKQAGDLQHKFSTEMQIGIAQGESIGDLTRRVRGSRDLGYTDGLMSLARRNIEALVRSAAQSVMNEARLDLYENNPDVVKGLQWRATLDLRTSSICAGLDGLTWSLEDHKPQGHDKAFRKPPAHWRCRSTIIGVLKSFEELSKKPQLNLGDTRGKAENVFRERLRAQGWSEDKVEKAMMNARASLDGQVSRATTYEQWLKGRTVEEQKSVLGVGRWEMWNKGEIKLKDLTTKNLRPLSLDELEAL